MSWFVVTCIKMWVVLNTMRLLNVRNLIDAFKGFLNCRLQTWFILPAGHPVRRVRIRCLSPLACACARVCVCVNRVWTIRNNEFKTLPLQRDINFQTVPFGQLIGNFIMSTYSSFDVSTSTNKKLHPNKFCVWNFLQNIMNCDWLWFEMQQMMWYSKIVIFPCKSNNLFWRRNKLAICLLNDDISHFLLFESYTQLTRERGRERMEDSEV